MRSTVMDKDEFWKIFKHVGGNRKEIDASAECGCLFCLNIFPPKYIGEDDWVVEHNGAETAMCPRCGIDEVIGSASGYPITPEFLEQLHQFSFPEFPIKWTREKYGPKKEKTSRMGLIKRIFTQKGS
jgi:hypothetical protein